MKTVDQNAKPELHWADQEEGPLTQASFTPLEPKSNLELTQEVQALRTQVLGLSKLVNQLYDTALKDKGIRK